MTQYHVYHTLQINYQSLSLKQRARSVNWRCFRRRRAPWPHSFVPWSLNSANQNIQVSSYLDGSNFFIVSISMKQLFVCLLVPRSCKRSDTLFQKSLFLFLTWREFFYSQPKKSGFKQSFSPFTKACTHPTHNPWFFWNQMKGMVKIRLFSVL